MATNRIMQFATPDIQQPASKPAVPPGFVVCPPQMAAMHAWQQEIYRLAYERAQAAMRLPHHHRFLFAVWN